MKILCLILSIYIAFLSAVPCCSEGNCMEGTKIEQSNNSSQDHENPPCNACSPFFPCGSCAGFILSIPKYNFKKVTFIKPKATFIYKSEFIEDVVAQIWQPPQIS